MERLTPYNSQQLMEAIWVLHESFGNVRIEHDPNDGSPFTQPREYTTEELVVWQDSGEFGSLHIGLGTSESMWLTVTTEDPVPSGHTERYVNFEVRGTRFLSNGSLAR